MNTPPQETTLLVVEDDPMVRQSMAAFLENSGYQVLQAPNGLVGLAWVPRFCHVVPDYNAVLTIIAGFVHDPVSYWQKTGISDSDLLQSWDNAVRNKVIIPPYLQQAILVVRERNEQLSSSPGE